MSSADLASTEIDQLAGTTDPATGVVYPSLGMQPYYDWLMQSLHRLVRASLPDFLVTQDDTSETSIHVAPGHATIGADVLAFDGQTIDLASVNNDTALIHLTSSGGAPVVAADASGTGWPAGSHIKLAEVTVSAGVITAIADLRMQTVLSVS